MNKYNYLLLLLVSCLATMTAGCQTVAGQDALSHWPKGASPEEVGKRVAENFVARPLDFQKNPKRQYVIYPEVCAWYGSLTVAKLTGDEVLKRQLIQKFDILLTPEGAKRISPVAHVDYRVFGAVPLEIYIQTKDKKYLEIGQGLADKQWESPTADGITSEARYWIDDMYMIPAVQVQAFRATGQAKYLDRAALTMAAYLDKLQQPNGLFYHAPDVPFFWGRGNGWVAAGMTELLRSLAVEHPQRARILEGYAKMMAALLKYQGEDGLWRQLLDHPEAWAETSGSGMFTFAMISGVKHGWLDEKTYGPAARKGWLALVKALEPNGDIRDVCEGTNKKNDLNFYLTRNRKVGDLHGQAPVLWCASALLQPAGSAPAGRAARWQSLFNGQDLRGWTPVNGGVYLATNGCLHLDKGAGWLRSERPYTNFIFEAEWRALESKYNSGFFVRAGLAGKPFPENVWQVNLKETALGSLMKGSQTVLASTTAPLPTHQWVKFRIQVSGHKLQLFVDGQPAWQFDGLDAPSGYLGLQAEGKAFDFRNLRIQELP